MTARRVNVTVDEDVLERADKLIADGYKINRSAVFTEALRSHVAEIEQMRAQKRATMLGERPKGLDGIKGAKLDVERSIRRLRSQLDAMQECLEQNLPCELVQHAHAAVVDVSHIAEEAAMWSALWKVVDGTYKHPREELEE